MKRGGCADLPLHGGRVPEWLAARMTRLGTAVSEAVICHYGRSELLTRLSDPFWFQALGCVMGMDWHSSGITTSVMGALKRGLNPRAHELGIYICGGRGKHSRQTPAELCAAADREGLDGDALARCSRLVAKVDTAAVNDGFQLYLHSFVLSADGQWAIVQQGMNGQTRLARRYHWLSSTVRSFTADPHAAVVGSNMGEILNLVDARAVPAQEKIVELLGEEPWRIEKEARRLVMPRRAQVAASDINLRRLGAVLAAAQAAPVSTFSDALLLEGMGPRALQSLALVSEVVHGTPVRFRDPARFSFAHGGKDRAPFPVPTKVYDATINVLESALSRAKIGSNERLESIRRLHAFTRSIEERFDPAADLQAVIDRELALSPSLGGRSVFGWEGKSSPRLGSSDCLKDRFSMRLQVLPFRLAIAQLPAGAALPDWAQAAELWSVTRTPEELSLVCSESQVPSDATANRGWQALQVIGPLDFSLTGVIASLTAPLASCGISVFVLSTFATDYILVKAEAVSQAVCALQEAGHEIAG